MAQVGCLYPQQVPENLLVAEDLCLIEGTTGILIMGDLVPKYILLD